MVFCLWKRFATDSSLSADRGGFEGNLNLNNPIYSLFMDANHNMWVGTVFRWSELLYRCSKQFSCILMQNSRSTLSGRQLRQITGGPDEDIYCNRDQRRFEPYRQVRTITRSGKALHQRMDVELRTYTLYY